MSALMEKSDFGESKSLTGRTYEELRSDILRGRIAPDKKLRLKDLQERFSTSLSVVREALARLSSEGLVRALDQRGFVTASLSLADLKDLLQTRRQIESIAIKQAIELGTPQWEADVSAAYAELATLDQKFGDKNYLSEDWIKAHETFHRRLIEGCQSNTLTSICTGLSERIQRYRYLSVSLAPHRDAPGEHKEILQAVLARDVALAQSVLDKHYARTQEILTDAWTSQEN